MTIEDGIKIRKRQAASDVCYNSARSCLLQKEQFNHGEAEIDQPYTIYLRRL